MQRPLHLRWLAYLVQELTRRLRLANHTPASNPGALVRLLNEAVNSIPCSGLISSGVEKLRIKFVGSLCGMLYRCLLQDGKVGAYQVVLIVRTS